MENVNRTPPKFVRLDEVSQITGLGKSTILAWESQGKIPRAVRLSPTFRVWLEEDVHHWMREQHSKHTAEGCNHVK